MFLHYFSCVLHYSLQVSEAVAIFLFLSSNIAKGDIKIAIILFFIYGFSILCDTNINNKIEHTTNTKSNSSHYKLSVGLSSKVLHSLHVEILTLKFRA